MVLKLSGQCHSSRLAFAVFAMYAFEDMAQRRKPNSKSAPSPAKVDSAQCTSTAPIKSNPPSPFNSRPESSTPSTSKAIELSLKAFELIALAGVSCSVSQRALSPIYGSLPSSLYHQRLVVVTVLLAWTTRATVRRYASAKVPHYIPLLAFSIPTIQFFLFQYSSHFGAIYGPLLTELFTLVPLIFLSFISASTLLDSTHMGRYKLIVESAGPGITLGIISNIAQKIPINGSSLIWTRSGLQFVIATFYAILLPSRLLVLTILPVLHSALWNVHVPLEQTTLALNTTLQHYDYSLIARQESLTGYISVLDNRKEGFRVMRCDHSLLGGEWSLTPNGYAPRVKEPIYSVFAMLEAVRLVKTESVNLPDSQRKALVIGLGIGTTPSALIAHGIHTTIVEIDPVVHDFATKYFGLPTNHSAMIEDAVTVVSRARLSGSGDREYDFVIHDVFTGGAEPVDLFTQEFLQGLSYMLKDDGVLAINYAGDLLLPSTKLVVNTIFSVFPTCRIFREDPPPSPSSPLSTTAKSSPKDFTNMVLFCRKSTEAFTFRDVVEADCLGSQARRYHLYPQHEIDRKVFDEREEMGILKRAQTEVMKKWQRESSVGHWNIMRTVLPDVVWENW